LPFDLVKEIIVEGHNAGYRHLHITGGEPLLWEGLFEVLDHAFDLGYKTVFLNTNGILLSEDVNNILAAYDGISISVSLEGNEALHDRIRGQGTYRQTILRIKKVLDAGIKLIIFTTACKSLLPDLPHFTQEIYKKFPGIKYLTLIQLIRVKNDIFGLSQELLGPDDFLQLVRTVSLLNLYGLKTYVLNDPLAGITSKLLNMPWIPQARPLYRYGSMIVMANRDICLSHSTWGSFGKYEPGMISTVLASDEYRNAVAPDEATCPSCKYAELCMETEMVRPSEWYVDMNTEVPYCKRVLESVNYNSTA
jgi:MoaA/NifB/PqqE/SkfB family radical SAM enzyme